MTDRLRSRRWLATGIGLLMLALASGGLVVQARWLLALGYQHYAHETLNSAANGTDAQVSAEWAIRLTPFAVAPHLLAAAVLERQGEGARALEHSRAALRYGAADPAVWLAHAHLKLRLGQADDELTAALMRIDELAPRSYWVQYRKARLGLNYWSWSTPEQRAAWRRSVAFILDTDPRELLRDVLWSRQEALFCREFRGHTRALQPWCDGAQQARRVCFTPPVPPQAQSWCQELGFVREFLDGH
jgi:hypothetical protein